MLRDIDNFTDNHLFPSIQVSYFSQRTPAGLKPYLEFARYFRESVVGPFPFEQLNSALYESRQVNGTGWVGSFVTDYVDYALPAIILGVLGVLVAIIFPIVVGCGICCSGKRNCCGRMMRWAPGKHNLHWYSGAIAFLGAVLFAFTAIFLTGTGQLTSWGETVTIQLERTADLLVNFTHASFDQTSFVAAFLYFIISNFVMRLVVVVPYVTFAMLIAVLSPDIETFGSDMLNVSYSLNNTYTNMSALNASLAETNIANDQLNASLARWNTYSSEIFTNCSIVANSQYTTPEFTEACSSFLWTPTITTVQNFTDQANDTARLLLEENYLPRLANLSYTIGEAMSDFEGTMLELIASTERDVGMILEEYKQLLNSTIASGRQSAENILYNDIDVYGTTSSISSTFNGALTNAVSDTIYTLAILLGLVMCLVTGIAILVGAYSTWWASRRNPDTRAKVQVGNISFWPNLRILYWKRQYQAMFCLLVGSCLVGFLVFLMCAVLYIGGTVYGSSCETFVDYSINQRVLDNPFTFGGFALGDWVLNDDGYPLTTFGFLQDCSVNQTSWITLHLSERYNLTAMFSFSDVTQIQNEINAYAEKLKDLFLVSEEKLELIKNATELVSSLTKLLENIQVDLVDFSDVNFTSSDLSLYKSSLDNLRIASQTLDGNPPNWPNMNLDLEAGNAKILKCTVLENVTYTAFEPTTDYMNNAIQGTLDFIVYTTQAAASGSSLFFKFNEYGPPILNEVVNMTNDAIGFGFNVSTTALSFAITHKIAGCSPVYESYWNTLNAFCTYSMDGIDTMYLSAAIIGVLLIPFTILSIMVRAYFRRDFQNARLKKPMGRGKVKKSRSNDSVGSGGSGGKYSQKQQDKVADQVEELIPSRAASEPHDEVESQNHSATGGQVRKRGVKQGWGETSGDTNMLS
eukprot:Nk52_evm31s307 gene=Nk52_evmTU31s307